MGTFWRTDILKNGKFIVHNKFNKVGLDWIVIDVFYDDRTVCFARPSWFIINVHGAQASHKMVDINLIARSLIFYRHVRSINWKIYSTTSMLGQHGLKTLRSIFCFQTRSQSWKCFTKKTKEGIEKQREGLGSWSWAGFLEVWKNDTYSYFFRKKQQRKNSQLTKARTWIHLDKKSIWKQITARKASLAIQWDIKKSIERNYQCATIAFFQFRYLLGNGQKFENPIRDLNFNEYALFKFNSHRK